MKNFLVLIILLIATSAFSQKTVTKDSTYLSYSNSNFYTTRIVEYSNGDTETYSKLIGDTLQAYQLYYQTINRRISDLANDMRVVSEYPSKITEIARQGQEFNTITGINVLDSLRNTFDDVFVDNTWTLNVYDGSSYTVTFSIVGGLLKYAINGGATKNAYTLSNNYIRLYNFPDNSFNTGFILLYDGSWVDITRRYRLTKN